MDKENETFRYTYSASEQEEIKKIRARYAPKEADKLERVRKLDEKATSKATVLSLIAGVCGALVFGVGMCLCLVWNNYILGCLVGVIGIAVLSLAYPLYMSTLKKEREKIAPEILRLTDELMK